MAEDATNDVPVAPATDAVPVEPAASAAPAATEPDPVLDILTEGTDDPTKAAPSTVKDEKSQVADTTPADVKGDDTPTPPAVPTKDNTEAPPAPAEDATTPDVQPQGKAEERKAQLNTEIRDLVSQRNALRTEVEKINSEYYQPATADELVATGMDPVEAKVTALEQKQEVADYNNRVTDAQLTIESEAQRVLREFPVFDEGSKDYNKTLADEAAELFNDSLIHDENTGQVIGSNLSTYKLYKALATSHGISAQAGQLQGQKATEDMMARADTTPSASAAKPVVKDPILAILEDVDGN